MPIAFDAASTATGTSLATTLSVAHQANGVNRVVVIAAMVADVNVGTLTELMWAGSTITPAISGLGGAGTTNVRAVIGVVTNPTTASTLAEVSWSAAPSLRQAIAVISYTGVDQTTPYDSTNSTGAATTNATVTMASTDNGWPFAAFGAISSALTTGSGTIQRAISTAVAISLVAGDEASSGSVTINWTGSNFFSTAWAGGGFVLRPSVAAARISGMWWG